MHQRHECRMIMKSTKKGIFFHYSADAHDCLALRWRQIKDAKTDLRWHARVTNGTVFLSVSFNRLSGVHRYGHVSVKTTVKGTHVEAWNDEIHTPVTVRYTWADDSTDVKLYNREGLSVSPFSTDKG